jgi:ACS family sodium-dependent inorganic phosphate cotransporter
MMAVTIAFTMRSCLSMTMMQMVRPVIVNESKYVQEGLVCPMPSDLEFQSNGTSPVLMEDQSDRFTWDEETQGMILSAFYYGYIVTHIPGGWLAQRFGGKFPTVYTITSSSVLTLLTPTVAKIGPRYLIILRFIQGLGEVNLK